MRPPSRTAVPESSDEISALSVEVRGRGRGVGDGCWSGALGSSSSSASCSGRDPAALRLSRLGPADPRQRHPESQRRRRDAREALAISLARKGYAPVLLFSQGGEASDTSCPKVPRVSVVCFVDVTGNTRGEAEFAGRYAERHHWHSLMIVPGRDQVTRARLLTERCFSGRVATVPICRAAPVPVGHHPSVGRTARFAGGPSELLSGHASARLPYPSRKRLR